MNTIRKVERPINPSRRDVLKTTATLMIAALWGAGPAVTQEKRMTDTKKPSELPSVLTYDDVRAISPANAMSAVAVAKDIFRQRGIGIDLLPPAKDKLLPLNEEAETQRATQVNNNFGQISPRLVQNTTDLLFRELWLRPALAPRDRSLVTVSALIASGQVAQITYHLNRAMDNGLTQAQASEVLTHIAFYAGWPNAFSALPIVKEVFEKRHT